MNRLFFSCVALATLSSVSLGQNATIEAATDDVKSAADATGNWVSGAANTIANATAPSVEATGNWVSGALDTVKNDTKEAANATGSWVGDAAATVKKETDPAMDYACSKLHDAKEAIGSAADEFPRIVEDDNDLSGRSASREDGSRTVSFATPSTTLSTVIGAFATAALVTIL